MAVRFDASTDAYGSTAADVPGSAATVLCWFLISVDRNDYQGVWALRGAGNQATLYAMQDGTTMEVADANFATLGTVAATVGTWYRSALVLSGTAWTFYLGAAGAALTSYSGTRVAISSPANLRIGDDGVSTEWLNGRIADFKVYDAALSVAEVHAELGQYQPVRTANLRRFHPFVNAELVDYSGRGNTLTAGSTATATEPGPPIPWDGGLTGQFIPNPASGGGAVDLLGQASSTEAATGLGRTKVRVLGQAIESGTARPVTAVKRRTLGQPLDVHAATASGRAKARTLSQAVSTEAARLLVAAKLRPLGSAAEISDATEVGASKASTVGPALDGQAATPVGRSKERLVGAAAVAESALPVATAGDALGQAVGSETARPLSAAKVRALGVAVESGAATALTAAKRRTLVAASEASAGHPLAGSKARLLGRSVETDVALEAGPPSLLGEASETALALPVGRLKVRLLGQAVDVASAGAAGRSKLRALAHAEHADVALTMAGSAPSTPRGHVRTVARTGPGLRPGQRTGPAVRASARAAATIRSGT